MKATWAIVIYAFFAGVSLTLAICLTFGNAFPEPW